MKKSPVYLIVSIIASGGLAAVATSLGSLLPQYATVIAGVLAVVVAGAGAIKTYYDLLNAPATSIAAPAAGGNIPVVDKTGAVQSTVVTTDSTQPIIAPQAQ